MKWSFVIQQKLKAALLLAGVMLLIVIGNLVSRNHVQGIDRSFSSIYQDRLVPATTITYLAENLYGKRLSMEKFLLSTEAQSYDRMQLQLAKHNEKIDSLVGVFEKTYLVDVEAKSLSSFKNGVKKYVVLEKQILQMYQNGNQEQGKNLFEGPASSTFQDTISMLNELTTIQSDVGKQLMKESKSEMAGFSLISVLQISLVVVIGLMVLSLIQSSKIVSQPKISEDKGQQFHLN
jgi:hypothetical protein